MAHVVVLQADSSEPDSAVTFCQECGNNVHVECFKRWTASKKSTGEPVTCVYCRSPWVDEGAAPTPLFIPPTLFTFPSSYSSSPWLHMCFSLSSAVVCACTIELVLLVSFPLFTLC